MSGQPTVWKYDEWIAEARRRFGLNVPNWRFVCPQCGTEQTAVDLMSAGVAAEDVDSYLAFSCIGRFDSSKGCDWTLGGLFQIHEHEVEFQDGGRRPVFAFAEERERTDAPDPTPTPTRGRRERPQRSEEMNGRVVMREMSREERDDAAAQFEARRSVLEAAGVPALERLVEIGRGSSGQCSRVRRFLLGLYNGRVWPLDLTNLRSLDQAIQHDVLAVLAMDMAGPRCEVHNRVEDGEATWLEFAEREGGWPEVE